MKIWNVNNRDIIELLKILKVTLIEASAWIMLIFSEGNDYMKLWIRFMLIKYLAFKVVI